MNNHAATEQAYKNGYTQGIKESNAEIKRLQNSLAVSRKETKRYAMRKSEIIEEFVDRFLCGFFKGSLYTYKSIKNRAERVAKEMVNRE